MNSFIGLTLLAVNDFMLDAQNLKDFCYYYLLFTL